MAHHLAEVIAEANRTVGPSKAASEAQAVDLVLKLWAHRRALPEPIDPLGGYREAVEVLARLVPEANPWAYYRRLGTYNGLLCEMFQLLVKIVLAGVLLTQVSRARPVAEEEFKALEEEERYLHATLEQWMPFVARSSSRPEIKIEFVGTDTTEGAEPDRKSERAHDPNNQDRMSDERIELDDANLHATIVSNLERMQTDLADLLTRWRESSSHRIGGEGENPISSGDDGETMADDSLDTPGGGEETQQKADAEAAKKESTPLDQAHSFWSSLSLNELAEAQDIAPVDDLESIAALWPSDDDPDELLDHILRERATRRRAVGGGSAR